MPNFLIDHDFGTAWKAGHDPRHFGALAGRGIILVQRGDDRGIREAYRAALAVNPWLGAPWLGERHELIPMLQRRLGEKGI